MELLAAQRAQVRGDLARVEGPDGAQPRPGPARRRAPRRRRRRRAPCVVVAVLRLGPRGGRVADAAAARAAAPRVVRAERAAVLAGIAGGRAGRRARRRARVVLLVLAGAGLRRHVRVFRLLAFGGTASSRCRLAAGLFRCRALVSLGRGLAAPLNLYASRTTYKLVLSDARPRAARGDSSDALLGPRHGRCGPRSRPRERISVRQVWPFCSS